MSIIRIIAYILFYIMMFVCIIYAVIFALQILEFLVRLYTSGDSTTIAIFSAIIVGCIAMCFIVTYFSKKKEEREEEKETYEVIKRPVRGIKKTRNRRRKHSYK